MKVRRMWACGLSVLWALIGLLLPLRIASAQDHQITPWRDNHAGAVSLHFDDGYWSQVTNAVPLLNARGLRATFFLTTSTMDGVPWDQWRQVAAQGHEIGSHTVNHLDLTSLSDSDLRYELSESQQVINQNIPSQSCISLSYPGTVSNSHVQAVTSEYYIAARGGWTPEGGNLNYYEDFGNFQAVNFYNVASDGDPYGVPISNVDAKLDTAIAYHAWYNIYSHTIPDDTNYFATILDHIVERDLWMGTFGEVAKYMQERIASTLSVLSSDTSAIQLDLTNSLDGLFTTNADDPEHSAVHLADVDIAQGGSSTIVDSAVEGADTVVYFDAAPNNGRIILTQSRARHGARLHARCFPGNAGGRARRFDELRVTVIPTNGFSSAVALSEIGLPTGPPAVSPEPGDLVINALGNDGHEHADRHLHAHHHRHQWSLTFTTTATLFVAHPGSRMTTK